MREFDFDSLFLSTKLIFSYRIIYDEIFYYLMNAVRMSQTRCTRIEHARV